MSSTVIICMQRICAFMKDEIPKNIFTFQVAVCVRGLELDSKVSVFGSNLP